MSGRAQLCPHVQKQEQNARYLPHDSPSLTEPEPTVLTSLAGQHAPEIHLSPPFNAVDISSHAWPFTKVQRIQTLCLQSKGCNLPRPHRDVVDCNLHTLLSVVMHLAVRWAILSERQLQPHVPLCLHPEPSGSFIRGSYSEADWF